MRSLAAALVIAVTIGAAGCVSVAPTTTAHGELRPLVLGWEQYFKLTWEPELRGGIPIIRGWIFNDGGFAAIRVQLLVEGLDAAGLVTEQQVAGLNFWLSPGTIAPFEVALARPAATYRVSVFAFDWDQKDL
jgi:hypothetical protein